METNMTKQEIIERYGIEEYERRKNYVRVKNLERYHSNPEFKERHNKYFMNKYNTDNEFRKRHNKTCVKCNMKRYNNEPDYKSQLMDIHREYYKEYLTNENNKCKHVVRGQSAYILFNRRKHTRLKGYEIHHCFGYDDPSKFIYIPKSLHNKIHQLLRDKNLDADSNHYAHIVQLLNDCVEYTYVSV